METAMKIALDCDDVLINTHESLYQFYKTQYPADRINPNAPSLTWPAFAGDEAKTIAWFELWCHSTFYDTSMPLAGATDGVRQLQELGHTLYVVSKTSPHLLSRRRAHLTKLFGNAFTDIICLGAGSKRDAVQQIGAEVLVDDDTRNIMECHDVTTCIAMQNQVNSDIFAKTAMPSGVKIARTWQDVLQIIRHKSHQR